MFEHVESIFRVAGLRYEVLIDDLQQAIKEENPPLSPDVQEELEGRKGLKDFYYYIVILISYIITI